MTAGVDVGLLGKRMLAIEDKVKGLSERHGGGGAPPIDTGMEARVAKLEASINHVERDIGEIKADLRSLLRGGIGAFLVTSGAESSPPLSGSPASSPRASAGSSGVKKPRGSVGLPRGARG